MVPDEASGGGNFSSNNNNSAKKRLNPLSFLFVSNAYKNNRIARKGYYSLLPPPIHAQHTNNMYLRETKNIVSLICTA